jgi:hypothetical protein
MKYMTESLESSLNGDSLSFTNNSTFYSIGVEMNDLKYENRLRIENKTGFGKNFLAFLGVMGLIYSSILGGIGCSGNDGLKSKYSGKTRSHSHAPIVKMTQSSLPEVKEGETLDLSGTKLNQYFEILDPSGSGVTITYGGDFSLDGKYTPNFNKVKVEEGTAPYDLEITVKNKEGQGKGNAFGNTKDKPTHFNKKKHNFGPQLGETDDGTFHIYTYVGQNLNVYDRIDGENDYGDIVTKDLNFSDTNVKLNNGVWSPTHSDNGNHYGTFKIQDSKGRNEEVPVVIHVDSRTFNSAPMIFPSTLTINTTPGVPFSLSASGFDPEHDPIQTYFNLSTSAIPGTPTDLYTSDCYIFIRYIGENVGTYNFNVGIEDKYGDSDDKTGSINIDP